MIVHDNIFTQEEIAELNQYYAGLPVVSDKHLPNGKLLRKMKNSEYNFEDQLPYQIIHPKLEKLLGRHHFTGGHYLDAHQPFVCHVDNISFYNESGVPVYEDPDHKNTGVLIPLVEGEHFNTVFFDHYYKLLTPGYMEEIAQNSDTELEPEIMDLLDHHRPEDLPHIKKFKLDCVGNWKIGRVLTWGRDQLHCSSNFAKYGLTKQAIVLWV